MQNAKFSTESPLAETLTRREAAARLRERFGFGSPQLLAKEAMGDAGPPFYKVKGLRSVRYPISALDRWALARIGEPQPRFARAPKVPQMADGARR